MAAGIPIPPEDAEEIKQKIISLIMDDDALTFYGAVQMLGPRAPKKSILYEWRKDDPEWDKVIVSAQKWADNQVTQLCKHKATEAINAGDGKMIRFWLERKAKDDGFSQRVDVHTNTLRPEKFDPLTDIEASDAYAEMNAGGDKPA